MYLNTRECSAITGIPVRSLEAYRSNARVELDKERAPQFIRMSGKRTVYTRAAVNDWIETEYKKACDLYEQRLNALAEHTFTKEAA